MNADALLWILPAGSALYVLLAAMIVASREPGQRGAAHWVMLFIAAWLVGGMLEMGAATELFRQVGRELSFLCAALLPPAGLFAVSHFTNRRLSRGARGVLLIIPLLTVAIVVMGRLGTLTDSPLFASLEQVRHANIRYGHWFNLVHAPYSFGLVLLTLGVLGYDALHQEGRRRNHMLLMTLSGGLPMATSLMHVVGVDLYFPAPTSIAFAAVSPLVAWLILRHGVLTGLPLRHEVLFEQMYDGMVVVNARHEVVAANAAASDLLGVDINESTGLTLEEALPDLSDTLRELAPGAAEVEIDRDARHLALRMSTVRDAGLDTLVYLLRCRDVTRERAARRQLVRSEELLRSLIQNSSNVILRLRREHDGDYHVTIANREAAELFGVDVDGLVGRSLSATLAAMASDELRRSLQSMLQPVRDAARTGRATEAEFRVRSNKRERWYRMLAYPVDDDIGVTCIDITRQREQERELESAAFLDPLTGVLNRRGFERRASITLADMDDDATGAMLFVDLNNFKRVNDIHGHETGDLVLQMASERLMSALRDQDIVARLGGDEFVVLAPETAAEAAEGLRDRIESVLCEPYQIGNKAMNSSASVGMARFPEQGVTLTSLLRAADAAMYERKTMQRTTASGSFRIVSATE
ncbi:MAG: diguanylate cyclase [Pseudomonadota bacterium]